MTNVPYGVSRLELKNSSMINHTNAHAVVEATANMLTEKNLKPANN